MWDSGVKLRCQILSVQSQRFVVSVYGCRWECPGLVREDMGVSRAVWGYLIVYQRCWGAQGGV